MTNNIKRLASGFSALALILGNVVLPAGQAWADGDEPFCIDGGECYATLQEAFDVAPTDGTLTKIYLDSAESVVRDGGAKLLAGQNVEFDLKGKTYDISHNTVGSTGTETNAFQLLKGSTFVLRNGAVTGSSANAKIWVQNYATTTLEDVVLDATNYNQAQYVASNNFGSLTVKGDTQIIANTNGVAFDLWYGMNAVYDDGITVTFDSDFTGRVEGAVEYGAAGRAKNFSDWRDKAELNIANGTFDITLMNGSTGALEGANINVTGGVFTALDESYVADGYEAYVDNGKYYVIADSAFTIAFAQDEYSVAEGHDITLNATVTPTKIGASDRTDVVYSAYYTNGDELTNEEISVEGNAVSAKVGAIGTYKIVAEDMNGNTAEALLKVVAHGSLEVEDKTIYVDLSDWGDDSNVRTFAELGVTASGEGITYELSGEDNIYINDEDQTATIYGENVITWFYDGEERGKTTVKAYSVYDDSESYGIRVNGFYYYYPEHVASEGVTARIADETIAKFSTMTEQSGDEEYTQTVIEGLKAGETALEYVYDGRVVKTIPIQVYEITTTMKRAQAVGTSQTFTVTTSSGYKVAGFSVAAADSYSSEEENAEKSVEGSINKDGTYTITVNKMPIYTYYGYDDEGNEVTSEEKSPYAYAVFILEDKNGNRHEEGYGIVLFEFEATDEAAEAVDDEEGVARSNEKVMQAYVTNIIEEVMAGDINEDGTMELTLDDGTKVTISDAERLAEAVLGGETIEAVLTEPETRKESELGDAEVAKLKSEMGSGKTGHRFVEIDVELRAGGETVGKITELDKSLKVSVDVSDDAAVADGYTRVYSVVRYHGGKAEKLSGVEFDAEHKIVSFDSDRFSTYLIAYTDMPEIPRAPDTGIVKD